MKFSLSAMPGLACPLCSAPLAPSALEAHLRLELDALESRALESDDPYVVALAAQALQAAGRLAPADAARDRLKTMQEDDGRLVAAETSVRLQPRSATRASRNTTRP